jgi:hypothetical protein
MIAFDGMRVPFTQLQFVPRLLPAVIAALEHLEPANAQQGSTRCNLQGWLLA